MNFLEGIIDKQLPFFPHLMGCGVVVSFSQNDELRLSLRFNCANGLVEVLGLLSSAGNRLLGC